MEHPITPPPELVGQWSAIIYRQTEDDDQRDLYIATQAARWGADQELEACCGLVDSYGWDGCAIKLRAARRPKPPSLKEQALAKLAAMERLWEAAGNEPSDIVRRALEQLDD